MLLTTSNAQSNSKLLDWNTLKKEEKLKVITDIKDKKVTETIREFVDVIFTYNAKHTENNLLEILDKFCISYNQPVIQDKVTAILEEPFFKPFPKKNRMPYLDLLLAFILSAGRENAEKWQVKVSEFNRYVESHAKNYTSDSLPIPDTYKDAMAEVSKYKDFNFVKGIREIGLEKEIQTAVNDFFRTQSTVIKIENHDLFFKRKFSYYQDNVIATELGFIKSKCELNIKNRSNKDERINQSKATYFEAMTMEVKQIEGYVENKEFFQRGTIHTIVDSEENDFCWRFDE